MIREEDCKNRHTWLETEGCENCLSFSRMCRNCGVRQLVDYRGRVLKTVKMCKPDFIKEERRKLK